MEPRATWSDRFLFKAFKIERSYSQCGEDKILKHLFDSLGRTKIRYLDVGANHPSIHNNTYFFYRQGGSGVCVEPNPTLATLIRRTRPRDNCLNIGIGTEEGSADFYTMSSHSLSTFCREDALELDEGGVYPIVDVRPIRIRTINSVIAENFDDRIDLVSIDVEGWNEEIVASLDLKTCRPLCFCIETMTFSERNEGKKLTGIIQRLEENGYETYADTHLNTIFLDKNRG